MLVITYDRKRRELGMGICDKLSDMDNEKMGEPIKVFKSNPPKEILDTVQVLLMVAVAESSNKGHEERIKRALYHLNRWESDGFKVIPGSIEETMSMLGFRG